MKVDINSAILCDLIRIENNGKFIAIGIYSSSVVFTSFPVIAQFSLLTQVRADSIGVQKIEFRVMVSGEENQRLIGDFEAAKVSDEWIPVQLQPIQFQVPAILSVEHLRANNTWAEFFRINVERPPAS